uniref:Uncharacterized protein n=1 Tax=Anguilla anguilla TaxID=7936 RepID=A0A0E9QHB6_ANGAN
MKRRTDVGKTCVAVCSNAFLVHVVWLKLCYAQT